jgi:oligopeptide/dipeptide ABC transporter ATP-binding protein
LRRARIVLQGETPDPIQLPSGCRFHPRCPLVMERCKSIDPMLTAVPAKGTGERRVDHQAACLLIA